MTEEIEIDHSKTNWCYARRIGRCTEPIGSNCVCNDVYGHETPHQCGDCREEWTK